MCAVLTVEAISGNTKIADFGGGKVTISIPFELLEGKDGKNLYVAYVADDGTVTAILTTYAPLMPMANCRLKQRTSRIMLWLTSPYKIQAPTLLRPATAVTSRCLQF